MSSYTCLADSNDMWQSSAGRSGSPEITWFGTTSGTQFTPQEYLQYWSLLVIANHIDPRLLTPENQGAQSRGATTKIDVSPRAMRAHRRNNITNIPRHRHNLNPSPRAQQEIKRLEEYQQKQKSKEEMHHMKFLIQSKRRVNFRVIREALGQVHNYTGPYLRRPGQKKTAARLIREGGLGAEFVNMFDNDVKWKWLQIQVNNI